MLEPDWPNDTKEASKLGGGRQFNGLVDVYRKTLQSDGIVGLYRGFVVSCVWYCYYRGIYFGLYDTLKPMMLGKMQVGCIFLPIYHTYLKVGSKTQKYQN